MVNAASLRRFEVERRWRGESKRKNCTIVLINVCIMNEFDEYLI